jgi:hypothetical protein
LTLLANSTRHDLDVRSSNVDRQDVLRQDPPFRALPHDALHQS